MEVKEQIDLIEGEEQEVICKDSEQLAIVEPKIEQGAMTMWNNLEVFETTQRMARLLSASNIAPQNYRGNIADCVIAIDIANRMGLSPLVVMQNSQIVQGNFSWKGTACKAMIDGCGKYSKTRYVEVGEKGKDSWGFYLEAIDKSGEIIKGIPVTMEMAKKEKWYDKSGSKWQTMPELMLKYRASAFFMRTECASLAMGFLTSEENEDISKPVEKQTNLSALLQEELKGE
jgi:hypothetical protein